MVPVVPGSDTVMSIAGTEQAAPIDEVRGFNNVVEMDTIFTAANITGLASLQRVTNGLHANDMVSPQALRSVGGTLESVGSGVRAIRLPQLEEVGGDVIIERTRVAELAFPALRTVAGSLEILGNGRIEFWGGLAHGATIQGDLRAEYNAPVRDEVFENWLVASETTVSGNTRICGNRPREEEGELCQ